MTLGDLLHRRVVLLGPRGKWLGRIKGHGWQDTLTYETREAAEADKTQHCRDVWDWLERERIGG